tara:strand:- start:5127 stop:5732 length:606 start_codon:yes stop_codon:yes gene_type:complete
VRKDINIPMLLKAMTKLGHSVYMVDTKPYNLNIVGIRASNPTTNRFNDLLCVFWKYEGRWNIYKMQCTTLPGLHWLEKPMNPKGCAILKEGQYKSTYSVDKHNGKYLALCQRLEKVTVYRDDDKNRQYDMIASTQQRGMFGINIHRASEYREDERVNKNSAGCQVIQDPNEYDIHMKIVIKSAEIWGNSFTYTLINEKDLN